MLRADRAARLQKAKAIGRNAYRLAREGAIFGNLDVEGEEKRLTEYRNNYFFIEL